MKKALSLILALVMLIGLLPQTGLIPYAEAMEPAKIELTGKKISILGDSISTMGGVSNNTDYNSTIGNNAIYYTGTNYDVTRADTWWQQAIDALGMELCVSNAWSGSCIFDPTPKASTAYVDRCVQLHNDHTGEEPDIIAVYLGTNDAGSYPDTVGKAADINYDTLIVKGENGYTYADPTTASEAYAIMLHKITQRYPNAELYCFTIVNRNTFSDTIRTIATKFDANVVDLWQNSGIIVNNDYNSHYMSGWHPNQKGMDAMTNCFLSSIYKNSRYVTGDIYDITYSLSNVRVDQGTAYAAPAGSAFACTFTATNGNLPEVTVTMGGEDITATCYAEGRISIETVTGDIAIRAKLHNHTYTNVVTPPTCGKQGYTTHTCGCGNSYVDNYVDATEEHNFVNNICTGCGLDGFVLHKQGGAKTYYKTLEEALAVATEGTVCLLADATIGNLIVRPGVTLDLNGYTLTANVAVAMNGAVILDGGENCTGGGSLKVAKGSLALSKDNGNVVAIWNGADGYIFTKVTYQQMTIPMGNGKAQYIFLPAFSNAEAKALLTDGGADNEFAIKVSLVWNKGQSQQLYTYEDAFMQQVFTSNGALAFSLTVSGIADIRGMTVSAVAVTDSGAQAAAEAVSIIDRTYPEQLTYEFGYEEIVGF